MEKTDKNGDNSIISGIAVSDVKWDTHERIQIVVSMPTIFLYACSFWMCDFLTDVNFRGRSQICIFWNVSALYLGIVLPCRY